MQFLPVILWSLLTIICLTLLMVALRKAFIKTSIVKGNVQRVIAISLLFMVVWVGMLLVLSLKGFFSDFSQLPPRPVFFMLLPMPLILVFAFSKKGSMILRQIPAQWLLYLQAFRIGVELLLWMAYLQNKLPVQMTFEGGNLDILTGILALPAGYLVAQKKFSPLKISLTFNLIGIALLLNILVIALLSMPTPFRHFTNEPSNVIITQFPYILLPGVLVPIAYGLHILSLRKWHLDKKQQKFAVVNQ